MGWCQSPRKSTGAPMLECHFPDCDRHEPSRQCPVDHTPGCSGCYRSMVCQREIGNEGPLHKFGGVSHRLGCSILRTPRAVLLSLRRHCRPCSQVAMANERTPQEEQDLNNMFMMSLVALVMFSLLTCVWLGRWMYRGGRTRVAQSREVGTMTIIIHQSPQSVQSPDPPPAPPAQPRRRAPAEIRTAPRGEKYHLDAMRRAIRSVRGVAQWLPCKICSEAQFV